MPSYRRRLLLGVGQLISLLTGLLLLVSWSHGAPVVAERPPKTLTPRERMERIVESQQRSASTEPIAEGRTTLSGTIRTCDGKPLPVPCRGYAQVRTAKWYRNSKITFNSSFSLTFDAGHVWLYVQPDGYAPAILGPIRGKAGETVSGIDIVLEHGFSAKIRVVDEIGKPVEGVSVTAFPVLGNSGNTLFTFKEDVTCVTDAQGIAVLPNALARPYTFSARKPGFQPMAIQAVPVEPGRDVTLTLARTPPTTGVVVSADERPLARARVYPFAEIHSDRIRCHGGHGYPVTQTDSNGRFVLDELTKGLRYVLLIVTEDKGQHFSQVVMAGERDLRVEIGPELVVSGKIHGDLETLEKRAGKPIVTYHVDTTFTHEALKGAYRTSGAAPVESRDGEGRFTIRSILPGRLIVTAGKHVVRTEVNPSTPRQQVVINLTQPVTHPSEREVVMRFATPDGQKPQGTIHVFTILDNEREGCIAKNKTVSLQNGVARFSAYAPGRISYSPEGFLGYDFNDASCRVEQGLESLEITVPVTPAGGIAGRVFNADGTPAFENVTIGAHGTIVKPGYEWSGGCGGVIQPDEQGRFFVTPLRLGGTFTVSACREHNIQVASPIEINAAHPTRNVTLHLPPTIAVEGRVLDPNGHPVAEVALGLAFMSPVKHGGRYWTGGMATDSQGHFRITDLSVGVGEYALLVNPRRDFRPLRVPLPLDGKPTIVRLQRGLILEGQVVNDATDLPVAGAELIAMPEDFQSNDFCHEAEGRTDEQGRFRFSTLADRAYRISSRGRLRLRMPADRAWKPGGKVVVLRVTTPEL